MKIQRVSNAEGRALLKKKRRKSEDQSMLVRDAFALAGWSVIYEDGCLLTGKRPGSGALEFFSEYRFQAPRRWRFDWACPRRRIAIEVNGGRWMPGGGRHGSEADMEKMRAAAILGWRVLPFSPRELRAEPARCVDEIASAFSVAAEDWR